MPGAESHSGEDLGGAESRAHSRLLYELGCAFSSRLDLDELLPFVISECREAINATGASVLLVETETNELYFPYVAEEDPEVAARLSKLRFPADRGIAGAVLRSGESVRVDDVQSDPRFYGGIDRDTGLTTRTILCVPLFTRQGTIGVLQVINRRDGLPFSAQDLALLEALAGSIAVAIENARLYARVKATEERLRAQVGALRRDLARRDRFDEIIGTSPAMAEVFRLMESAAASPIAVLIEGETGTGKELVARGIHRASARAEAPVRRGQLRRHPRDAARERAVRPRARAPSPARRRPSRGLLRGGAAAARSSSTRSARCRRPCRPSCCACCRRARSCRSATRAPRTVDVRVIAATNRDLQRRGGEAERSARISTTASTSFPIALPPLRERREDIPLLVDRLLEDRRRAASASRSRASSRPRSSCCSATPGPGTCASWRTRSSAPSRSPPAARRSAPWHLSAGEDVRARRRIEAPTFSAKPPLAAARAAPRSRRPANPRLPLRQARAEFEADVHPQGPHRAQPQRLAHRPRVGLSRVMLQKKMKEYGLRDDVGRSRDRSDGIAKASVVRPDA